MFVEPKSPDVEVRSKTLILRTSGGSKKFISDKRNSWPSPRSMITDNVRRSSSIEFSALGNRDRNQRSLSVFSLDSHFLAVDHFEDVYDYFVKREEELTDLLSLTQIELEEKQVMLEEAVGFGEQLIGNIRDLNEKLTEQIDLNSLLKKQVHFHTEANNILTSALSEAKKNSIDTRNALYEANESTSLIKMELEQEKIYSNRIQDDYIAAKNDFHTGSKNALEALEKRLEEERAKLVESLWEIAALERKIRVQEDMLNQANSELAILDRKLVDTETSFNGMILALTAAKEKLETENNSLTREIKILEKHLKETNVNERLQYNQRTSEILSPQNDVQTLADEIAMTRDLSGPTNVFNDRFGRISQRLVEQTMEPQIPEIIQSYLRITAIAVQLSFPHIKHVNTEMLIENVISSPFYLYHDLMKIYMRKIENGLADEDASEDDKEEAEKNLKSASEQPNFFKRFFWLKQDKDIMIRSKHKNSVISVAEMHSPFSTPEKYQNWVKEVRHLKAWQLKV